jgi:hypothetical protein
MRRDDRGVGTHRGAGLGVPPVDIGRVRAAFSIVVCSIDDSKLQRVSARYRHLLFGVDHEIVSMRDALSLAEAYNLGDSPWLERYRGAVAR